MVLFGHYVFDASLYLLCVFIDAILNDAADGGDAATDDVTSSSNPHQILEFFEMCCALITTLAK